MALLRYLALMFIDAVGITHPSREERDRAALYIVALLAGMILLICTLFCLGVHYLRI